MVTSHLDSSLFARKVSFQKYISYLSFTRFVSAQQAAEDYVNQIVKFFPDQNIPKFDVLLLGMGPDGHTCSLFPDHSVLDESSVWVAPILDSPKPPPQRVTFTYPVINNARLCIFITLGENKADAIKVNYCLIELLNSMKNV